MATPESSASRPALYPAGLLEWAGHRSGGVRRFLDDGSGRPAGELIQTPLLHRLREWASAIAGGKNPAPRIVLLLGGPGNGKTEAIEEAIASLEEHLAIDGKLRAVLQPRFNPADGSTVPRLVSVPLRTIAGCASTLTFTLVQDASLADSALSGKSAASLLVDDLEVALGAGDEYLYLACINRGVLDDAFIAATDAKREDVRRLLEAIVQAVGTSLAAPACWPLSRYPAVAIWPMDVESLLATAEAVDETPSPAAKVLTLATAADRWPEFGTCAAGRRCPFCSSRTLLSSEPYRSSALRVFRWYELATGKRWSFRDLFSLVSFILAGSPLEEDTGASTPCERAARLIELTTQSSGKPDGVRLAAPFLLVASQYQHALFGVWAQPARGAIRAGLRELKLDNHPTLLGLHHFLSGIRGASLPSTLRAQLVGLSEALDPALADPDLEVDVSGKTSIHLRDLDARFSNSVRDGLVFIRRYQGLSVLELDLLGRLADADDELGTPVVRRRKPTTAAQLQVLLREFACRLVRRSIGARSATVRDQSTLQAFERVVGGNEELVHLAVKQVEGLLNDHDRFVVTLNTTFGEPLPPEARRVILTTARQKVRPAPPTKTARPQSDARFLTVGSNTATQAVPLTYELFRSVRELQSGLLAASLPRTVIALLDTTRARLAGRIVRDEDQLDGSEIRIGSRGDVIVRELGKFLIRNEEAQ